MAGRRRKKKRRWLRNLLFLIIFLFGAGVMFYPMFSDLWNNYRNEQLSSSYTKAVETLKPEDFSAIWEEARAFNAEHTVNTIVDAFDEETNDYVLSHPYDQVLDPAGNGIMGYVEIPKINVKIAIYHGTGTEALENGCGHIEGTSLPIGGVGTHAVLSAHRGLPSAKLFTDLDQIEVGDLFLVTVLDAKLAYRVDQILTVLPEETEALAIEPGRDLVTLVTCTPYGVNSHRLLVRGERTEYVEEEAERKPAVILRNPLEGTDQAERFLAIGLMTFLAVMILLGILLKILDWRKRRKKRRAGRRNADSGNDEAG